MSTTNVPEQFLTPHVNAWIERLGVNITTSGDRFVLRDPTQKKYKLEGGNLEAMLARVESDRSNRTNTNKTSTTSSRKDSTTEPTTQSETNTDSSGREAAENATTETSSQPATDNALDRLKSDAEQVAANKPEPPKRQTKGKGRGRKTSPQPRPPSEWKTYKVGMLIMKNPDKSPEELLAMCKAEGIQTQRLTIVGLGRYFQLHDKLLTDIAAEKQEG